ncbi:substrate-binding domain-containing protein [Eubacterium xylanophilum]|uniref:substrate-binding domain-containing protein n=1 Tax=Eubacterium xylanophilum TaxID=39497 RepID=UPI00047C31D1|nr:substrate-binding domain-containing protein [Eubacterium xylanophilum]
MGKKKEDLVIGIVTGSLTNSFTREIITGAENAVPAHRRVRIVLLSGKFANRKYQSENEYWFRSVSNCIYGLADTCNMDGLIIASENAKNANHPDGNAFLKGFKDIPKVLVASRSDKYVTVNYDNESGIREALDYMTTALGVQNICMLGGRDDNEDAVNRKRIVRRCLEKKGIMFRERQYVDTNMSDQSEEAAKTLLDRNPNVEAIFCVNDAVAVGLYNVMKKRGLVPGKDILVFGFDNTKMAGEMYPPLASIGARDDMLGQKAMELMIRMIDGEEVESVLLPTRLYGRDSFEYQMYKYNTVELSEGSEAFIYRMFDDCFYRYRYEKHKREDVDLRRLFYEIVSRMLLANKQRYMGIEEFGELWRLVDIFFANGAMKYSDSIKFINSITRFQNSLNANERSGRISVDINRLFGRMRDDAFRSTAEMRTTDNRIRRKNMHILNEFLAGSMIYETDEDVGNMVVSNITDSIELLGVQNAILYIFEKPLEFNVDEDFVFDKRVFLRCVIKNGILYTFPRDRQERNLENIFIRNEMATDCETSVAFPVFFEKNIYGILVAELTEDIYERGEYVAMQLGISIRLLNSR